MTDPNQWPMLPQRPSPYDTPPGPGQYGPPPQQYGPPPPYSQYGPQPQLAREVTIVQVPPTSGLAVASLICGILGLVGGCYSLGIPSILAVLLGHAALGETKTGQKGGHGLAVAGMILGYILAIPAIIMTIMMFMGLLTNPGR